MFQVLRNYDQTGCSILAGKSIRLIIISNVITYLHAYVNVLKLTYKSMKDYLWLQSA